MDQDTARAYCDAGYMPLGEYLRFFPANGSKPQQAAPAAPRFSGTAAHAHNTALKKVVERLRALALAAVWPRKKPSLQTFRDVA